MGELNHGKFFLMLLTMCSQYIWTFSWVLASDQIWSGLTYNTVGYEEENNVKDRQYTKEYGAFFMSGVIVFLAILFSVMAAHSGHSASLPPLFDINELNDLGESKGPQNQLYPSISCRH